MVKKTPPPIGPEHSREREFTAILEDLRSQFRAFGESLTGVHEKLEKLETLESDMSLFKSDMAMIKSIIPTIATKKDLFFSSAVFRLRPLLLPPTARPLNQEIAYRR